MDERPNSLSPEAAGWRRPDNAGAWRAVASPAPDDAPPTDVVLPVDAFDPAPTAQGEWHLPRTEDTSLQAPATASVVAYAPRPEDVFDLTPPSTGSAAATAPMRPEDTAFDTPINVVPLEDAPADTADAADTDTERLSASEQADLADLVSRQVVVDPQAESPTRRVDLDDEADQAVAAPAPDADDPRAYAQRQLADLGLGDEAPVDVSLPAPAAATLAPATPDPAEEARQALAQKFRTVEEQVRVLREQYYAGALDRAEFETRLRALMILDDQNTYWMMGVETDQWYRYDGQEWMVAEPPVPLYDLNDDPAAVDVQSFELPRLGDPHGEYTGQLDDLERADAGGRTVESAALQQDMPLPSRVDERDLQATVPSKVGTYMEDVLPGSQPTIAGVTVVGGAGDLTVPNAAVSDYVAPADRVQRPLDPSAIAPPDYDDEAEGALVRGARRDAQRTALGTLGIASAVLFGLLLIVGAGVVLTFGVWYSNIAQRWRADITGLANYAPQFQTARILDVNGNLVAELDSGEGARTNVRLSEVSPFLIHAVVSAENERFFIDPGWDLFAILRAFVQNFEAGQVVSGGSTITQQVVENLIIDNSAIPATVPGWNPTVEKRNEIIVAGEVARTYSKEEILELYLNEVYFGNLVYGVEAAAQFYFDKPASQLNLPEAALLAALIPAPAAYDPVNNREEAFRQMERVLARMAQVGCLNIPYQAQAFCVSADTVRRAAVEQALVETREYLPRTNRGRYPHFVNFVQAQLEQVYTTDAIYRRGFTVQTTLNPRVQDAAQDALRVQLEALRETGVNTGGIMVTDPRTGAIRAMIGSPDFNNANIDGQVNTVLTWQQPGSALKPVLYAAAFEGVQTDAGPAYYTPATVLWDVPTTYPDGTPIQNFGGRFNGLVSARSALASSLNIPAVKTYAFIGNERFLDVANRMGLRFLPEAQFGLPTALGATEVRLFDMMITYGTLANQGERVPLYAIDRITDSDGNNVDAPPRSPAVRAISPQVAYLVQNILADEPSRALGFGPNTILQLPNYPNQVAAKTGTSNDARDLWTMGFTTNAVVGVWLGRPDNAPTTANSGYIATAPLWRAVMDNALRGTTPGSFTNPGDVVARQVCDLTGALADATCPQVRNELSLINQPPPPAGQGFVQRVAVDTWTGLRANDLCPNDVVQVTFANLDDPTALAYLNNTAQGRQLAQRLGLPLPVAEPPTGACDLNTPILQASVSFPPANGTVTDEIVQVQGTLSAANLASYELRIARAEAPDQFVVVDGPFAASVTNGRLGQWDTTNFQNGSYILRLAATSNTGGFAFRDVPFTLNKPLPTPTPTPTVTPTSIPSPTPFPTPIDPFEGATPIPLPPLQFGATPITLPLPGGGGGNGAGGPATPTATISPAG